MKAVLIEMKEVIRKALVVITWKVSIESPESQVLLLKVIPRRGSFWQPVTGKVEEGETYREGALREAAEETGFLFERFPQPLGLDWTFKNQREQTVREEAFFLPIIGGSSPPTPTLDPKEHNDFRWLSPKEAVELALYDGNKQAIERAAVNVPPLFLSRTGDFFQQGEEITHERTKELLHQSLIQTKNGFLVRLGQEELDVVVEDVPLFVRSFDAEKGLLHLSNGTEEPLNPSSLTARTDHSFTCRTKNGWTAKFLSSAYYELAKLLEEKSDRQGSYVLRLHGRDYEITIAAQGEGIDR